MKNILTRFLFFLVMLFPSMLFSQGKITDYFIRNSIIDFVDKGYSPNMVIGTLDSDRVKYYYYGYCDKEKTIPVDENSVFAAGQITNVFTNILFSKLKKEGLVTNETTLTMLLPKEFKMQKKNEKKITLYSLSNHLSGLPSLPSNMKSVNPENPFAEYTYKDAISFLASCDLNSEPGSKYSYSDFGISLLGSLLALKSGKDWNSLLLEKVLNPMGLKNTSFLNDIKNPGFCNNKGLYASDFFNASFGLSTTVTDMISLLKCLLDTSGKILEGSYLPTLEKAIPLEEKDVFISGAWHIRRFNDTDYYWASGRTLNGYVFLGFCPKAKKGLVIFNASAVRSERLAWMILAPGHFASIVNSKPEIKFKDLAGEYETEKGKVFTIIKSGNELFIHVGGNDKTRLIQLPEKSLFYPAMGAQISFERDNDGNISSMIILQECPMVLKRVK